MTVYVMFVIPVAMWIVAAVVIGFNVLALLSGNPQSTLAAIGSLAAAGFARLYWLKEWRIAENLPEMPQFRFRRRSRPRLSLYRDREDRGESAVAAAVRSQPKVTVPEQFEAELDRVLEKVAREGKGSLTMPETDILLRASEIYKRRRGG
jgi:hypothetical protein